MEKTIKISEIEAILDKREEKKLEQNVSILALILMVFCTCMVSIFLGFVLGQANGINLASNAINANITAALPI